MCTNNRTYAHLGLINFSTLEFGGGGGGWRWAESSFLFNGTQLKMAISIQIPTYVLFIYHHRHLLSHSFRCEKKTLTQVFRICSQAYLSIRAFIAISFYFQFVHSIAVVFHSFRQFSRQLCRHMDSNAICICTFIREYMTVQSRFTNVSILSTTG